MSLFWWNPWAVGWLWWMSVVLGGNRERQMVEELRRELDEYGVEGVTKGAR